MKTKSILSVPFHPFVLALYFPLTLFYLNIEEAAISSIGRAIIFTIAFAMVTFLFSRLVFNSWKTSPTFSRITFSRPLAVPASAASKKREANASPVNTSFFQID